MGQYYKAVILGKTSKRRNKTIIRHALSSYDYKNGAKLMEHSYVGNYFVNAVEQLLADEFYGFPFVWAGDYADTKYKNDEDCVYGYACEWIAKHEKKKSSEFHYVHYDYIINFDEKQYVKIPKDKAGEWTIHPLPLLCADGNQRGCGDYYGLNEDIVGSWSYNRIGMTNNVSDIPNGYTELEVIFKEE